MKILNALLLLATLSSAAWAGEAADDPDRLDALLGEWSGSAWTQRWPQRVESESHELVRRVLGGTALLIEGNHFAIRDGVRVPVHTALALIRRAADGSYRIHSYLSDGRDIEASGRWVDDEFQWGFALPDGSRQIRYRMRLAGDTWVETGETSSDGQAWTKFFEMNLVRQVPAGTTTKK